MRFHLIAIAALAASASFVSFGARAADKCSADLEGNDAMKYNLANIDVPKSCASFTINLKHTGKLAKTVMGHNVVIAKTADMAGIDSDGMKAGAAADYVKADDARVVAHSKLVGGGESSSVSFPVAKITSGGPYAFFCSFPGHSALMKGTLTIK
ncbi:azurin [Pseudoxanthomonas winnipegensis]|uniref:Azurin n=1 Tax=Pseudoxanthomonas winnipegensis TaxID=2480810 RepID=A0A4Q8LFS1_9GAMM|nr:azurin [Pseudoxanthomonas winnipegensis]RZZ81062.1 azurin [Pseudoxanthomonas winnipegensis]TAA27718.1 azurin [Pseudoxanthomonas winnipegensis]TAA42054.1 azurin [Pseudoxanthomonas winnipegensis]TBV70640.1 azurin [Pseudoxanthomonas winnipegensis]